MTNPLLDRVLPAELANRSKVIEYKGVIGEFSRLRAIAEKELRDVEAEQRPRDWQASPIEVSLAFGWLGTDREHPAATGHIRAAMPVVCQRCLEAFELPIDVPVRVLFGGDGGGVPLNAGFDAWDSDDEAIRLADVVEESVIMAMPLAPAHGSAAECGDLAGKISEREPGTVRPFADLRAQMDELNK